jgi:quercetin dioxygenase-like cupin family protein
LNNPAVLVRVRRTGADRVAVARRRTAMRTCVIVTLAARALLAAVAGPAFAQDAARAAMEPATPASVRWVPDHSFPPGAQVALVYGNPGAAGEFTVLVRLPAGYRIPPHTHPVDMVCTVLSGSLYMGMGEREDPGALREMPRGSVFVEPAKAAHFGATRDSEVIVQVTGYGPTGTTYVRPEDDPRRKAARPD